MSKSAQLVGRFLPGHEWEETCNKLEAFRLFAYADQELSIPQDHLEPLSKMIGRAFALENFRSIWALEGVAHYYTTAALAAGPVKGLLSSAPDNDIPERTLVSMHAGMGTAFAESLLSKGESDLRGTVNRFFDLCRENAAPGWYDNAAEPMGLVVRSMYPHLLGAVGEVMGAASPAAQHLYWHGVGRSLYFVPTNFMTFGGSHSRALEAAISEAPSREDRLNSVAGLVWAVTLVNLRQPAVLRNLLRSAAESGIEVAMDDAIINGIVSAVLVWRHMVPGERAWLTAYTRLSKDDEVWNRYVVHPSIDALAHAYPVLQERNAIASLFSYRPVAKIREWQ